MSISQKYPGRSRLYLIMLILCISYSAMSLVVLGMHVYSYNKTVEFNDAVAREFGNQTNMTNFESNNTRLGMRALFDSSHNLSTNVSFNQTHRRLDRDFIFSTQHRTARIFGVLIVVSAIGVVLPIVAGIMLHRLSSSRAKLEAQKSALAILTTQDEKEVVLLLQKAGGSLTQSELVSKTGLTKVKIHRVIVRLVALGIIEKHAYGMTNKIVLVDTLRDI